MELKRILTAATVLTALAFTASGCSSSDAASEPGATTTTPQATVETTAEAATINQWASVVAPLKAKFEETQAKWDDQGCNAATIEADQICQIQVTTMKLQAETIEITLGGLSNADSNTYLGTVPSEIGDIYTTAVNAAATASASAELVDCPGDECLSTAFDFSRDWDALGDALTAWEPYL